MAVRLSGSALPIAKECRWWLRGDVTYPAHESFLKTPEETDLGSAVHMAGDRSSGHTLQERIALACNKYHCSIPEVTEYLQHLDAKIEAELEGVKAAGALPEAFFEVSFAYDPLNGSSRLLGCGLDREYEKAGLKVGEIPCSLDLVIVWTATDGRKLAIVIDFKTGQQVYVSKVQDNPQLTFGALCADRAFGCTTKQVKLWFCSPHRVWEESYDVDPFMVPALENQIRAFLKELVNEKPLAKAGDHCQFCPALGACPVTAKNLGMISPGEFEWSTDIKSVEHAAWMAARVSNTEKSLDYIREALKRYSDSIGGIPLDNGQVWGPVESRKESLNTKAVKAKLAELGILEQFMQVAHVKSYRATGKKA